VSLPAIDPAAYELALAQAREDVALGLNLSSIHFDPQEHPRDLKGRFRKVLGALKDKDFPVEQVIVAGDGYSDPITVTHANGKFSTGDEEWDEDSLVNSFWQAHKPLGDSQEPPGPTPSGPDVSKIPDTNKLSAEELEKYVMAKKHGASHEDALKTAKPGIKLIEDKPKSDTEIQDVLKQIAAAPSAPKTKTDDPDLGALPPAAVAKITPAKQDKQQHKSGLVSNQAAEGVNKSPARSPTGKIRNLKAMGDTKLNGLTVDMIAYVEKDLEAAKAVYAEQSNRGNGTLFAVSQLAVAIGNATQPKTPNTPPAPTVSSTKSLDDVAVPWSEVKKAMQKLSGDKLTAYGGSGKLRNFKAMSDVKLLASYNHGQSTHSLRAEAGAELKKRGIDPNNGKKLT
jgi:hypothetical protein